MPHFVTLLHIPYSNLLMHTSTSQWISWVSFSPRHNITEILLKVALSTIKPNQTFFSPMFFVYKVFEQNFILYFSWFDRNGDQIGTTGNIYVDDNTLVFKHPQQIDTGNYTCLASNLAGIKKQSVWIIVSGRYILV